MVGLCEIERSGYETGVGYWNRCRLFGGKDELEQRMAVQYPHEPLQ
jgi:hypothetical protein